MGLLALRDALQQAGSKILQHGENSHVDSIVIITILLMVVFCFLLDVTNEGAVMANMICQIVVFTFSRSVIAWWAKNHESGRWTSWLAWRNTVAAFHLIQLLVALSPWGEGTAPFALARLRDSTIIFPLTSFMIGFVCGVEPGTHKAKVRAAGLIVTLIAVRLLVLARVFGGGAHGSRSDWSSPFLPGVGALYSSAVQTADQRELLAGGFRTLLCAPLLGAGIGMAVRAKLEQQNSEIGRLLEHASNLEAARHEALMAPRRLSGVEYSGSPHPPSPHDVNGAKPTPPPQPLPPQHPVPQCERSHSSGGRPEGGGRGGGSGLRGPSSVSSYGSTLAEMEAYHSGPESEDLPPPPPPLPSEAFLRVASPLREFASRAERDDVLWRTLQESGLELTEELTDGGTSASSVVDAGAGAGAGDASASSNNHCTARHRASGRIYVDM
jgi:hypothetical protein